MRTMKIMIRDSIVFVFGWYPKSIGSVFDIRLIGVPKMYSIWSSINGSVFDIRSSINIVESRSKCLL